MKTKAITCFLLVVIFSGSSFAQKISKKEYSVYTAILDNRDTSNKIFFVNKFTSNVDLKQFYFKDPAYNGLHSSQIKSIDNTNWKTFLSNIDTATFIDHKTIKNKFTGKYKVVVIDPQKRWKIKKFIKDTDEIITATTFSSIQFSVDQKKAVCTSQANSGSDTSCGIYFLAYENNRWKIIAAITLYLS